MDVPESLVQIPPDYSPIEHDRWIKLEQAKVTYDGRVSRNATVFRAPRGELFIRVNDWTYLVRPGKATVEQTKEPEAYSLTGYRIPKPPSKWKKEEDTRVLVKPNSVTFRSTNYERDKAMIEVSW